MWDEKDISYNTYMTYQNVILNYIDPALGTISLPSLKRKDLLQVLLRIPSPTVRKHACAIAGRQGQKLYFLQHCHENHRRSKPAEEGRRAAAYGHILC